MITISTLNTGSDKEQFTTLANNPSNNPCSPSAPAGPCPVSPMFHLPISDSPQSHYLQTHQLLAYYLGIVVGIDWFLRTYLKWIMECQIRNVIQIQGHFNNLYNLTIWEIDSFNLYMLLEQQLRHIQIKEYNLDVQ